MIVKYSDCNFLIVNPTCIQLKFGFPPHPRGACLGQVLPLLGLISQEGLIALWSRSPLRASAHAGTARCTGQIHAGLEQESAILMQMTVQVFIKTTQKIPAALIEGLIQSAAGLLFKLKPVLLGTCAGAHAGTCHPKTQTKVLKTHFFLTLPFYFSCCMFLPHQSKREKLITAGLAEDKPLLMWHLGLVLNSSVME